LIKRSSLFNLGLFAMVISHTLVHAAGNMQGTLYPILQNEFVLSNRDIAIIAAAPQLAQVLFTLPAGAMSDRFGARKLVALSIVMGLIGALLAAFTVNPLMYIVALVLLTLNSTFYHPPSHSYTSRMYQGSNRSQALGFLNAGGTFGVSVGPLSISLLMGYFAFEWRQVYLFWVIPIALGLFLLFFIQDMKGAGSDENHSEPVDGEMTTLLNRDFIYLLSASGVRQFALMMITTFLSIFLVNNRGWTVADYAAMTGLGSLMGIFASPVGGWISSRVGDKRWAVISLGTGYLFYLAAFFVQGIIPFMLLYLIYSVFGIMAMASTASLTAKLSPPKQIGMGFALSFLPASLVGVGAPIVAAFIADSIGMFPIFMIGFVILFMGLGVLHFGVKVD
jgi:MFS family permease